MTDTKVRKLLLVTRLSPAEPGVGTIFLRGLLEIYPSDRIAVATWSQVPDSKWPDTLRGVARRWVPGVPEYGFPHGGRLVRRYSRWLHSRYAARRYLRRTIAEIVRFGREQGVEALWVPLASPTEINLAAKAARELNVPLLTLVWDPPAHYLPLFWGLEGRALGDVMHNFDAALRASERCAVASDAMKVHYEERYGVPCVTMIHGFPRDRWIPPSDERRPRSRFILGYAGSIYAKDEWKALLDALASANWSIGGREVTVRVLSSVLAIETSQPVRIDYLGWRPQDETLRLLSEVDACYIPYWFDPKYREAVKYCFPNKIPTYLAAGRPLFFHGPEESTPAQFIAQHPVGIACHSREPSAIVAALRRFIEEPEIYRRAAEAIPRVLDEELSEDVFRRQFSEFVAVPVECLRRNANRPSRESYGRAPRV